ncbi:hypothetical protein [Porphyromonas sp. oral taxon 275]|uniref:hypothetical protein n=1 Tax=Porphyromonas sp. oral taxon 275 TaxID=712435 RepID=UPI001BA8E9ED|nr:hypothetical protein [Porphyromonas sp. oral taxon 275]QUB43446.1 hypothetical protein J4862_02135 [Porphyromonas sp. oral taxon 275]
MKSEQDSKMAKEHSKELLTALYQQIFYTSECVVPLYDVIEDYLFQDLDYQRLMSVIPLWMIDAGRSPESMMDKECYEQLRSMFNDPVSNRIIHWADMQGVLNAFQDRVMSIRSYLEVIYKYLPTYCLYEDSEYEAATRGLDETSDKVHTAINNVFVSLCSSFDLFTKVVYECSEYDSQDFSKYKKLKCRTQSILYKKGNFGFDELKADGLLYSEPKYVRTAISFRDEFIHNGAWDYRCAIYYPFVEGGNPVEPFILMPDIDIEGRLVSSGTRNKFYAKGNKINVFLPELVKGIMELLNNTIKTLINVLQKKTSIKNKTKATEMAICRLLGNQIVSKKNIMGDKYSDEELLKDMDFLMPEFLSLHSIIARLCKGLTLTKDLGIQLMYSGYSNGRPFRMLMFVLLLNETANLRDDAQLAYHLLKEAYIMTDNIYGQLKKTTYDFALEDYLENLENELPNRNSDELTDEEKYIYEGLPQKVTVYRGMCDEEKQSRQFGISWTMDKNNALDYVFYKKNEVIGDIGWCANMEIDKSEIFAVWGVKGEKKEIVINPKKCKNISFCEISKKDL